MKFLQYAVCSLVLTLSAAGQMTPASPSAASQSAPSSQSATPQATTAKITNLDGEEVKGPEHPITLEQMRVLYAAMGYQKSLDENLQKMIAANKQRNTFVPVAFWDDLDSSFKKIDYPTALLEVYKKYISTEDADKLIAFSKTEAGKHFFETLPDTSREGTIAISKQQQQTGTQVQARHKDEIDAARKAYMAEHAPKPTPAPTPSGTAPASPSTPPAAAPSTTPAPATPPASTTPQN